MFEGILFDETIDDNKFNSIYPKSLQNIAEYHFTPLQVCRAVTSYFAAKSCKKVLDIGSGAGKFCLAGSVITDISFTGVEQRGSLNKIATKLSKKFNLKNTRFIQANIIDIDFSEFDGFYFFNAFYENICKTGKLNDEIVLDKALYELYSNHVKKQLSTKPIGTCLVTYFSYLHEVPESYSLVNSTFEDKLKMWEKTQ